MQEERPNSFLDTWGPLCLWEGPLEQSHVQEGGPGTLGCPYRFLSAEDQSYYFLCLPTTMAELD